jgi:hypothetical protein
MIAQEIIENKNRRINTPLAIAVDCITKSTILKGFSIMVCSTATSGWMIGGDANTCNLFKFKQIVQAFILD